MERFFNNRALQTISAIVISLVLLFIFNTIKPFPINIFVLIASCSFYILSGYLSNSKTDTLIRMSTLILIILTGGAFYEDASHEEKKLLEWYYIFIPMAMLVFMVIINKKIKIKEKIKIQKIEQDEKSKEVKRIALDEMHKKNNEIISLAMSMKNEIDKLNENNSNFK